MASVYLRPTADNYCTFAKYPADSTSAYALIDDVESDGESTYIGLTAETADTRVTASASFMLSGSNVTIPLDEYRITGLKVVTNGGNDLYVGDTFTSITVTSNGLVGMSNLMTGRSVSDMSFDRSGDFLDMFRTYYETNGHFPDVQVDITRHCTPTKDSQDWYISQLYLEVIYNAGVQVRDYTPWSPLIAIQYWAPATVLYKKRNGSWESVRDGVSQLGGQFNKSGHRIVGMAAKAAKCTTTGLTRGCKCEVCQKVFVEQTVVPATGHGETEDVAATEATCAKDGYTAGTKCSVCNTYLSGHETIPATGNHTPEDVAATEPGCGSVGYTAGTKCSVCNTYLSGHETIPATGNHTPVDDANGVEATDIHDGYTSSTSCSVCGAVLVDHQLIPHGGNHVCTLVTVPGYAATCVSTGLTDGQQCSVCGKVAIAQEVIPATGVHNYVILSNSEECSMCGDVLRRFGLAYYNQASSLSVARDNLAATSVGNYALFAGGMNGSSSSTVDAYDTSLTRTIPTGLSEARYSLAATSVGNYALFGGGSDNDSTVDAYDTSLTRTIPTGLSEGRYYLAATSVGNYALFGGGSGYSSTVDAYVDYDMV